MPQDQNVLCTQPQRSDHVQEQSPMHMMRSIAFSSEDVAGEHIAGMSRWFH